MVDFYRVVTDYARYPEFVSGVKAVRMVGEGAGLRKVEFDLEMMKRVRYSLNIREELNEAAGTASVQWTLDSSDMLKSNVGGWTMQSTGPNTTDVVYKLDIEFSISVPGFILKGLVANSLPTAVREFRERAEKLKKG